MGVAVQIRLFANLKEKVGRGRVILEFDKPPSIKEVLDKIRDKYPEVGDLIFDGDQFDERYRIVTRQGLVSPLRFLRETSGDSVAILPPVSGG